MLKITADTNILVSAAIAKGNEFEILRFAKLGKIELILSMNILKEFKDVISRPKFGFSEEQVSSAFKHILSICTIVVPSAKLDIIKEDPDDNKILECADAGKVDYIVSGDGHLLNLEDYNGIKIVKAGYILKLKKKKSN